MDGAEAARGRPPGRLIGETPRQAPQYAHQARADKPDVSISPRMGLGVHGLGRARGDVGRQGLDRFGTPPAGESQNQAVIAFVHGQPPN